MQAGEGKAAGSGEIGGSGRSSKDAVGQHNPGRAKDPWNCGVLADARTVPTCLWANGKTRSRSERSTKDASNSKEEGRVPEERSVPQF